MGGHRCCFMVLNLKPHPKPFERMQISPERCTGIVTEVLPDPDHEPPEFVSILLLTWQDHQVSAPVPIHYPQNRKMAGTPLLTVQNTNEYTPLSGF